MIVVVILLAKKTTPNLFYFTWILYPKLHKCVSIPSCA